MNVKMRDTRKQSASDVEQIFSLGVLRGRITNLELVISGSLEIGEGRAMKAGLVMMSEADSTIISSSTYCCTMARTIRL